MNTQEFKDACAPYWFNGVITLKPNATNYQTDNPHYFTAWFFRIAAKLGEFSSSRATVPEFWNYVDFYRKCITHHGIIDRDPDIGRYEKISHDELVGCAYTLSIAAIKFHTHAINHYWSVDNRTGGFTLLGWLPRSLYAPAYLCVRSLSKVPLWAKLLYALDALTTPLKPYGITNGKMQLLLVADDMLNSSSWIIRKSTQYFLGKMQKTYGETWGGLVKIYFPGHPFSEAAAQILFNPK